MSAYSTGLPALIECDLIVSRGSDNVYPFNWSTSDGAKPPVITPVNLTGYTAAAQLRDFVGGIVWLSLATGSGITLDAAGNITLAISHTATVASDWDSRHEGVWDIELTSGGGIVTRVIEGAVLISQDVTR